MSKMNFSKTHKIFYIVGAGSAGISIFHDIQSQFPRSTVIFLDDDEKKSGTTIEDISIIAPIDKALSVLRPEPNSEVIIAMPSAPESTIRRIYQQLKTDNFPNIKILPSPLSCLKRPHLAQTQKINLEDLLSRKVITLPDKQTLSYLHNKRVIITGAGGSIGSELAVQLLYAGVSRMYLLGHGEYSIYTIHKKLQSLQQQEVGERTHCIPVLCELTNKHMVQETITRLRPDVIFHTAAYKHVDMVEANPIAGIAINVFGTQHLLEAATATNTAHFILVSTDKAVEPISVYGASKLISEELLLNFNVSSMATSVMRFGNVIGSRGSVVPLFQKQIAMGGPITITSPECKRYFMTISEACSLMLYALQMEEKSRNTLYTLEMGEQISVLELAKQILEFYGLEVDKDISFSFIGLRKGERLREKLLASDEKREKTPVQHVYKVSKDIKNATIPNLKELIALLHPICFYNEQYPNAYHDNNALIEILTQHIRSFSYFKP